MKPGSEDAIHIAIVDYLRAVLVDALVYHAANGGGRQVWEAVKLKKLGVLAGVPDIHVVGRMGLVHYIEVKTLDGALSDPQVAFRARCRELAIPYGIARSINDARDLLVRWGLQTREAA